MKDPKHALLMLNMAATDMQAVTNMMEAEKFSDSVFGFHAQQAIEKLCKAWLSMEGIQYPRTHDLRMLMRLMGERRPAEIHAFADLVDLTDYAVQFRYEAPLDLEPLKRESLRGRIQALYRVVASRLEGQHTRE